MNASDLTQPTYIDIPGRPDFFYPVPKIERFSFPLEVRSRLGFRAWLFLPLAFVMAFSMFDAINTFPNSLHSVRAWISMIVGVPIAIWLVIAFTGAFLTLLHRTSDSPLLILTAEGLLDRRLYNNVIQGGRGAGWIAVRLKLRHPLAARPNLFRIGTPLSAWRRRPDELYVPILNLTVRPHTLAQTIKTMVERAGGAPAN